MVWFYRFALDERSLLWYEKWEGRNETVQIFFMHFWLLIKSFQVFWVIELRRGKGARPTEGNYNIFPSCGGFIARWWESWWNLSPSRENQRVQTHIEKACFSFRRSSPHSWLLNQKILLSLCQNTQNDNKQKILWFQCRSNDIWKIWVGSDNEAKFMFEQGH